MYALKKYPLLESPACKNLHMTPSQTRKNVDNKKHFTFQEQTIVSQAHQEVIKAMISETRIICSCSLTLVVENTVTVTCFWRE